MTNPFGIVGPDGRPISAAGSPVLIDPATGKPENAAQRITNRIRGRKQPVTAQLGQAGYGGRRWARDQKMANRTRDDGRLTRKARKARTRIVRTAYRMGMLKRP